MLVLVIALLAMLAMLATTFLVSARYDRISTQSAALSHQMEMLLSMLEGSLRTTLAGDLWGDNQGCNNPGDNASEGYDGPDDAHPWLTGICGNLIEWEKTAGAPSYVQPVADGDAGWVQLPQVTADGLVFRYALLIQDLGGLVNVNVARRPDPDMLAGGSIPNSTGADPADWPYSIWDFHAGGRYVVPDTDFPRTYDPRPDWGYWWYTPSRRKANGPIWEGYGGMGRYMRGGGPLHNLDLRPLLTDSSQVAGIDRYFRRLENYGRSFDTQDEMDLRFPGMDATGGPHVSMIEVAASSLFTSGQPSGWLSDGSAGLRRRLVTAIGRTTNWQRRREPILMHPYEQWFWNQVPDKAHCDESWYFRFDYPHNDDMIKYYNEARMGFRMPIQRGITFSRFWPDDPYDIYIRLNPDVSGNNGFPALCGVSDFPGAWYSFWTGEPYRWWPSCPPFQYDDYLTEWQLRDQYPSQAGDWQYAQGPSMAVLLLANTMANLGIPPPDKDQDDPANYAAKPYAHLPGEKSDRVRAYRRYVAALHLNMEDYQDANTVPGILYGWGQNYQWLRFKKYGIRGGAENRPYISEVVMEFELWPDYCILYPVRDSTDSKTYLKVVQVRMGSGAEIGSGTAAVPAGLQKGDFIAGLRLKATDPWTDLSNGTHAKLRGCIQALTPGTRIELLVRRSGVPLTLTSIPLEPAVKTIAVEVYNPYDYPVELTTYNPDATGVPIWQYVLSVPQDCEAAGRKRAFFSLFPIWSGNRYPFARKVVPGGCVLYIEQRGTFFEWQTPCQNLKDWMNSHGLAPIVAANAFVPTNKYAHYDWTAGYSEKGEGSNLSSLRPDDGEIILGIVRSTSNWRTFSVLSDVVRNTPTFADPPPTPATGAVLPPPAGVAAAFSEARGRMLSGAPNPVVRLYRPLYMESRATQFLTASNTWMAGASPSPAASRLGRRDTDEDDFPRTLNDNYCSIDARSFPITTANQAFRFGADLSRVTRLTQPGLKNTLGDLAEMESGWYEYDPDEGEQGRTASTEIVDREIRRQLAAVATQGDKTLNNANVRRLMQKAEARLRFSPYTPANDAERAECAAWYDFLDAFTAGGAAYDNIDNNGNAYTDEHGTHTYSLGIPPELQQNDPGGFWLQEHSNCWPAYGRINVNTAPREVLENCLVAPTDSVRKALGKAICDERGDPGTSGYKPFKTLGELYARVSAINGHNDGFDRFGFDGVDNHAGAAKLPDMPPEPYTLIDDLEERNYLWRVNSEAITLRSDTFAVYLRLQARRKVEGAWKIVAERRVYSIWDRANCIWPPNRRDGKLHPDYLPPQRIGIQIFGY